MSQNQTTKLNATALKETCAHSKMDLSLHSTILLISLTFTIFLPSSSKPVYNTCATQTFNNHHQSYGKFKELMDEAFLALESGILNSDGFYTANYKSVKLMAQCEGDSNRCECWECVSDAVQVVNEECGGSVSAQIYLDKCFISYAYDPESDGDAGNSVPGASRSNTQKLIAIIVGGAAVLFLGLIFLSLLSSRLKKDDNE